MVYYTIQECKGECFATAHRGVKGMFYYCIQECKGVFCYFIQAAWKGWKGPTIPWEVPPAKMDI